MKTLFLLTTFILFLTGCSDKNSTGKPVKEILKTSDPNTQFVLNYDENGKIKSVILTNADSSQRVKVFFDTADLVRATILEKNGKLTHAIEYHKNGRPMGLVNFDTTETGDAVYYYDNGNKKSEGRFTNHRQTGIWKDYNDKGEIIKIDTLK